MKKILLVVFLEYSLIGCAKHNYPDDVYYSEPVHPKYEYPEYQMRWPLFNYFLPTYPQFYGPYYYMPYYRIYPTEKKIQHQNKPSVPIRKFEKSNE